MQDWIANWKGRKPWIAVSEDYASLFPPRNLIDSSPRPNAEESSRVGGKLAVGRLQEEI